jgi:hypothetical protein
MRLNRKRARLSIFFISICSKLWNINFDNDDKRNLEGNMKLIFFVDIILFHGAVVRDFDTVNACLGNAAGNVKLRDYFLPLSSGNLSWPTCYLSFSGTSCSPTQLRKRIQKSSNKQTYLPDLLTLTR